MEDYSGRKPKKDGIKAHKAAQQRKGDWLGRSAAKKERKPQREHTVRLEEDFRERHTAREPRYAGGEQPDREDRRKKEAARQKRRQRRQIRRLITVGALALALILTSLLVKAAEKGNSKKTQYAKAKSE